MNLKFWSSTLNYSLIQIKNEKNINANKVQHKLLKTILVPYLSKKERLTEQQLINHQAKTVSLVTLFQNQKTLLKQVIQTLNQSVHQDDLSSLVSRIDAIDKTHAIFKEGEDV